MSGGVLGCRAPARIDILEVGKQAGVGAAQRHGEHAAQHAEARLVGAEADRMTSAAITLAPEADLLSSRVMGRTGAEI